MNTLITLKQSGNYEQDLHQLIALTSHWELQLTKYKKKTMEINATRHQNPMDNYPELGTTIADLKNEQNSDPVTKWLHTDSTPMANLYSTGNEQKYLKQLRRLCIGNRILYRQYLLNDGKLLHRQLCVPKTIVIEVMYRIHNAPTGGHLGITRFIEDLRKRFYCPNYVEKIADYIRNCSACLQMKQGQPARLRSPLQEVSTLKFFPGDLMQVDILGPFPSSPYK